MASLSRITSLQIEAMRGLPKVIFQFNGKSVMLVAGNGRGKSSLVDGIEYLFGGRIERFYGTGTGAAGLKQASAHLTAKGVQMARAVLDTKGTAARAGKDGTLNTTGDDAKAYCPAHGNTRAYMLRRADLLKFISAQDAEKYQQVAQLLSLETLNARQTAFVSANARGAKSLESAKATLKQIQDGLKSAANDLSVESAAMGVASANTWLQKCGEQQISKADDLPAAIKVLEKRRPKTSAADREKLSKAKQRLDQVGAATELVKALAGLESAQEELHNLRDQVTEVDAAQIVYSGFDYVTDNEDLSACPLCERELVGGVEAFRARLEERRDNLALWMQKVADAITRRTAASDEIKRLVQEVKKGKQDIVDFGGQAAEKVDAVLSATDAWRQELESVEVDGLAPIPKLLQDLQILVASAGVAAKAVEGKLGKLSASDSAPIEAAILHLEAVRAHIPKIEAANSKVAVASALSMKVEAIGAAFKAAREKALEAVFDKIAETVLTYYKRLHNSGDGATSAECKGLKLKPAGRAEAGGLTLNVDSFGKAMADPRAYLSDGHIDSLGLCIFLASVKHFHPPGALVVLDDVLTSIDADHRHAVAGLLLTEFKEYQLLVTTHDEYWGQQFKSAVEAVGAGKLWDFRQFVNWTLEFGPETKDLEGSRAHVAANLKEPEFREIGGSLRLILEAFLKRAAEKLRASVQFKANGNYTAADFGSVRDKLRKALLDKTVPQADVDRLMLGLFGTGDLVNALSHDKPARLTCSLPEVKTFVAALDEAQQLADKHEIFRSV